MSDEEFQRLWSKLDRPFSGWFLEEKGDLLREASLSRAREKRLEERLRTYVRDDECKYGMDGACDPGEPPCRFCSARAALSEET